MQTLVLDQHTHIAYQRIEGSPDKPCLVFLHEGLGCMPMWKGFPELLCEATGCPGLVYDRQGYGQSSPLTQTRTVHYMHDYALQELPRVLSALLPDTPFILVGHSDGASISLIYGAEQSPWLKGIISAAAHVYVEDETVAGIRLAKDAWQQGKLKGLHKYHGDKTETIFNAWAETWLTPWFKAWNIEYALPGIEAPLLVIQGQDDQYASDQQVNDIVDQSAGVATGHLVPKLCS